MLRGKLERPEIVFTAIFIPIAAFSWVGILLAEFGVFSGGRVAAGGVTITALAFGAAFGEFRSAANNAEPVSPLRWSLLGLLFCGALALFSRPGEYLIEGADSSVYLATGRHLERTGGIIIDDPLVPLMPDALRSTFFVVGRQGRQQEVRFPGGFPIGRDRKVQPGFFHLLPVWIAIATAAAGPWGGYFVNVVCAALAVFLVALIGRRLWSPAAGLVAATLLTVNFGQIFHAGIPSSEALAQFLVLATIFFTLLAWDQRTPLAGACAGVAAGLAAFTRVDMVFLIVIPMIAWLVLTRLDESLRRARTSCALLLGLLSTHALAHGATVAQLYIDRLFQDGWPRLLRVLTHFGAVTWVVLAFSGLAAGYLMLKYRRRSLILVGACAAVALTVLPTQATMMLNLLMTPPGLITAIAGLGLALTKRWDSRVLLVVVPLLMQTALLLVWTETILLPGDFRRAVPIMLPGLTLLIGLLVAHVASRPGIAQAIWFVPVGLGIKWGLDSAPIVRTPPMQGVEQQVSAIANEFPPDALIISDGSVPGHLAMVLQYEFERPSVRLFERPSHPAGIAPLIHSALAQRRPVFAALAPMPPTTDRRPQRIWRSDFADFDIEYVKTMPLHYTVIAPIRAAFPHQLRADDLPVAIYRVSERDRASRPLPFVLDVGGDDFRSLVDGFHAAEQIQSSNARWSNGDARIALPRLAAPQSGGLTLVVRASADRPRGQSPAIMNIVIDGLPAGSIGPLTPRLSEYRIAIPPDVQTRLLGGPTMMAVASSYFVPSEAGINGDSRKLGVLLDSIRIE